MAVGGGLVTDVAGFAAATYHRGIAVIHVPTTLLGMVDAAIGGKTGVNLPEGKNLVGAFWQPAAVLCDLDALATLPERECRSGLGEMAKYHFLTGDDLLTLPMEERVAACVAIKAAVVSGDEREAPAGTGATGRAVLNYGHTLAHALEIDGDHDLRHGEAVADRPGLRRRAGRRARSHRPAPRGRPQARARRLRTRSGATAGLGSRPAGRADGARQEGHRRADVRARRPAWRRGGGRRPSAARRGGAGPHGSMSR